MLVGLEKIIYACKLAITTPFILNEKPVSIMILAPPEHAKTEILKLFSFVDSVQISTDFNTYSFSEFALMYPKKRTIIIPDFLRIVKRKYSTQSNALTILNALTEEGWIGKLPLGQVIEKPIIANVLTSLTEEELTDKRHKWNKIGFLSRFLPLSYSYLERTKKQIREWIKSRMYKDLKPINDLNLKPTEIILPKDIADKIEKIILEISEKENILGFRLQRQLQTLAMANALLNNRNITIEQDYEVIKEISKFINYKFTKI